MANLDLEQIAANIRDLVDAKNTPASSLFYRYKDQKEIGEKIFKELLRRYVPPKHMEDVSNGGKMGFIMDDTSKEIGLLSQSQGLQALLLLASNFGLDFDTPYEGTKNTLTKKENGEKEDLTIRMIMDFVIEDIINRLTGDQEGEHSFVFDSSPYMSDAFDAQYAYIDCITWVIPTFLLVLRYHVDKGEICRYEREMVDIIKAGLRYLNEAYIRPENAPGGQLTRGWNFTKDCEEPSLYFTYAVAECYVDFYNTFKEYLDDIEAIRDKKEYGLPLDEVTVERIRTEKMQYEQVLAEKELESITYSKGEKAFFDGDPYNELKRIYMAINDGKADFDSPYGVLETYCKEAADMTWSLVQDKFADYFYFNDLHATITEEDLGMSTTNDALFNSMYIINILLDAGVDVDIQKRIACARLEADAAVDENLEDAEKAAAEARKEEARKTVVEEETEYNNLLDTCQLALQKAIRAYEKLKAQSREYIVDQFLVGFNEKFTKLEAKVRELRKLRIRVFSLVPLFIKTNSVIAEYLVRYPQNTMKKYLGYILENRYVEKKTVHWIWEQDGYFSASNYYYVSALADFYNYYQEFEQPYVDDAEREAQIRELHLRELEGHGGKISELRGELKKLGKERDKAITGRDAEIARLKEELAAVDTPIEDAVKAVISDQMKAILPVLLTEYFKETSHALIAEQTDRIAPAQHHKELKESLTDLLLSFYAAQIDPYAEDYYDGDTPTEQYEALVADLKRDVSGIMDLVAESLARNPDRLSGNRVNSILHRLVSGNLSVGSHFKPEKSEGKN